MTLLSRERDSDDVLCPAPLAAEELSAGIALLTAERDAALAGVAALRARLDHDAKAAATAIERLTREVHDARRQVLRLESYRSDHGTLERIAGFLSSGLAMAAQNEGLEVLQGNLGGAVAAWQAAIGAELAVARAERDTALAQHQAGTPGRTAAARRWLRRAVTILRGRVQSRPAPSRSPPAAGLHAAKSRDSAARLDGMVRRVETEMLLLADLLRGLSSILGVCIGTEAAEPGSELYKALPLEGQLVAWIRFDAARQRRTFV